MIKGKKAKLIIAVVAAILLICIHASLEWGNEAKPAGSQVEISGTGLDRVLNIARFVSFLVLISVTALLLEGRIRTILIAIPILGNIFEEPEPPVLNLSPNAANKIKSRLLQYTIGQSKMRLDAIIGPEVFSDIFPIETEFIAGAQAPNDKKDWNAVADEQFLFITGASGSGKSFELINRVDYLCKLLAPAIEKIDLLTNKKIPLYIELKSLDRKLDEEWTIAYIQKTSNIANMKFDSDELSAILDSGDVVYFFDGVDEIASPYRAGSVKKILELSEKTGVCVSCRRDMFDALKGKNVIPLDAAPAELYLKPLAVDWILEIIGDLKPYSTQQKAEMTAFVNAKNKIQEHLTRPIILNLFIITFNHLTDEEKIKLGTADEKDTLRLLWENYEAIIVKKKLPRNADILLMRTYTVWLAKIMQERPFFIESIQPDWLSVVDENYEIRPSKTLKKLFYLTTRVIAAMVIGLAMGCIIATPFALLPDSIVGGIFIALLAGIYNTDRKWLSPATEDKLFPVIMIIVLVVICGFYQGTSVPHMQMTTPWFCTAESFPGIILGITLSVIFSYRIIMEKQRRQYILPVEIFNFDWFHAFRYGLSRGFFSGLLVGTIAFGVKLNDWNPNFINGWLIPQVDSIADSTLTGEKLNLAIFLYGFAVMFIVSSLIIVVMAGRYSDKKQRDDQKQKLNYAIKESFRHALINALKVGLLSAVLYYSITYMFVSRDFIHCITFPVGMSLLAFFWFGGMEGLNHILLRVNLYIRGISPGDYSPWVQAQQDMGLIVPTGFQMKFYHPTLATYYSEYPVKEEYIVPRIRIRRRMNIDLWLYAGLFVLLTTWLVIPLVQHYSGHHYWHHNYEINPVYDTSEVLDQKDGSFKMLKEGKLQLSASGHINVGTFVGWVWPRGTLNGFMGVPIHGYYNISGQEQWPHGALLWSSSDDGKCWENYSPVVTKGSENANLTVNKGERIRFVINDKEPENNSGHYKVVFTFFKLITRNDKK